MYPAVQECKNKFIVQWMVLKSCIWLCNKIISTHAAHAFFSFSYTVKGPAADATDAPQP
jgi:hypothetical protein